MKEATEIVVVLDKSGSMQTVQADTIGGYNTFIEKQKSLPGEANLTLVLFDTTYVIQPSRHIKDVPLLNNKTYQPSGMTALNDAIGRAIVETGNKLSNLPEHERPGKILMVVITDGEENSSKEHNTQQIKDMITHQHDVYNWEFIYLGANVNSFDEARKIGISIANAANYKHTDIGTRSAFDGINTATQSFRESGSKGLTDCDWQAKVK